MKTQSIQFYPVNYFFLIPERKRFHCVDIEPQRLKDDMKLLEDHLIERRLPVEQRELQTIAQNVIQNLLKTEGKFDEKFFFVIFVF